MFVPVALLALGGCVRPDGGGPADRAGALATLQIIAFNDFHGHIDPGDQSVLPPGAAADAPHIPAGGAVHFAAAIARLRAENPQSAVVSAGDLVSGSPLVSGHFLDEPTVRVMNQVAIDFNAVGNHEFDRGPDELLRMQRGGCAQYTLRAPCQVMPDFPGAHFGFLAANVHRPDGETLLPPFGIKQFDVGGRTVRVGFVGMTLQGTPQIVVPRSVAGLRFAAEAQTANALVPALRAAGADILAVLIHEGGAMPPEGDPGDCGAMTGALPPILAQLDPAFDLVISGHTHQAYVCRYGAVDPARPFLVTSAGQYGTLLTRITLRYDLAARRLVGKEAENVLVEQRADAPATQAEVAVLVDRYGAAAADVRDRVVGTLGGALTAQADASGQSTLGNFIADAQRAEMRAPERGGAQIAFMNRGGLRAPIQPGADGQVRYGDLYGAQPFGNTLMVKALTGAQIRAALEYQFSRESRPSILSVSQGFSYVFDAGRPAGERVFDIMLEGRPLDDAAVYRVAMSNFIAQGGDGFTMFVAAPVLGEGPVDVDALEAYIAGTPGRAPPALDRIRTLAP